MWLEGEDGRRFRRRIFLGGALVAVAGYAGWRRKRPSKPITGVRLARRAGLISSVEFSRDGRFAVTAGELVRVWDVDARKLVRSFPAPARVRALALDDQRGIVVVSGWVNVDTGHYIAVLDLATGRAIRTIEQTGIGVDIDGIWLTRNGLIASYSSRAEPLGSALWEVDSGRRLHEYRHGVDAVAADGRSAVGGSRIWDLETESVRAEYPGKYLLWGVAVSPDGSRAVSQGGGTAFLWNDRGERVRALDDQRTWLWGGAFSPDDRFLLTGSTASWFGSSGRALVLRDARTGEKLARLEGHRGTIPAVAWTRDSRRAISGDREGNLFLWTMPAP
jgi:WD40 repeat protein